MENLNNIPQRTFEWMVQRLGFFTGSEVGKLMVTSRKKGEIFGETAKAYILKKMAERHLIDEVRLDEEVFNEYQYINSVSSKALQFGMDNEPVARKLIMKELGTTFEEVGSIPHPEIPWFSSSPDGVTPDRTMCLEIKCPNIDTFIEYKCHVRNGEQLKSENSIYYWQAQSHMAVTGAQVCIFVVFNPFMKKPLHHFIVERNEDDIKTLIDRIDSANLLITDYESEFNI